MFNNWSPLGVFLYLEILFDSLTFALVVKMVGWDTIKSLINKIMKGDE